MDWNPGNRGNLHGSYDGGDPAGSLDPWGPPRGQTWFSFLENTQFDMSVQNNSKK